MTSPFTFRRFLLLLALLTGLTVSGSWAAIPAYAQDDSGEEKTAAPKKKEKEEEPNPDANDTFKYLSLFSDVLERVRADYVDPTTDDKLIESSLNGMLMALDPHSAFLNKKNFQEMQTQTRGEFGGLGIEVTMEENIVKVVSPIDDTPAAKAGIEPGDLITHIDDAPVTELTLSEAVDKMRGKPGTKIKLTIRRGGLTGKPFDVTIIRAIIKIKSVKYEVKDKDIGYIRITTFNEQTQTGLDEALADLDTKLKDKLIGYVLDMRNNPGGLLDQAISVSSTFLPSGVQVVSTRGRHAEDNQIFLSRGGDRTGGKPMVVMINNGSASASEIVAGSMQDHRRAIVVGTKSFGKGSVQTIIPMQNGTAIRLTTARYYTPSGRSIQAEGIEPDILVEPAKVEQIKKNGKLLRESDLKGALANDQKKDKDKAVPANQNDKDSEKPGTDSQKEDEPYTEDGAAVEGEDDPESLAANAGKKGKAKPFDYQLARALDLLHGISLYEKRSGQQYVPPGNIPNNKEKEPKTQAQ